MAKKFFVQHNSETTLTATVNNAKYFFPPHTKTEVFDKALAESAILDFNASSPGYKMEIIEEGTDEPVEPEA